MRIRFGRSGSNCDRKCELVRLALPITLENLPVVHLEGVNSLAGCDDFASVKVGVEIKGMGNLRSGKLQMGFTLIEVMIVVVIIGILASIAYPSYQQYIVRSNRADAQAYLMDLAQRQQQYLMDARTYAGSEATLSATKPRSVGTNYSITFATANSPPTFTITASPQSGVQAGDGDITIDQAGNKIWNGGSW